MRILLTGKNGQLGWELHRQLEQEYKVTAIGREDIDFLDINFLLSTLRQLPKFDLIVNAAAYTDIDKAEQEPFIAEAINSEAVAILAKEADRRRIPMIHFSTDHVFDGQRRTRPYLEEDKLNPISLYGKTKLEGEIRIRNILEKHWIFRLSGLYGIRRKNFFTEVLARNRGGRVPRVSGEQIVSPNWTPLVAEAVVRAIQGLSWEEQSPWGTYHLSGSGCTTPYEFARLTCERANDLWGITMPLPFPTAMKNYVKGAARRPKYSVLDSARFNTTFQHTLPDWREQFFHFVGGLNPNIIGQ
jgi:dTDP-4-dehydrorhamnose reductase